LSLGQIVKVTVNKAKSIIKLENEIEELKKSLEKPLADTSIKKS